MCQLRLRKTREGDLPGPGGEEEAVGAPPTGGVIWVEGVVPLDEEIRVCVVPLDEEIRVCVVRPDEEIRVCGGVRHHAVRAGGVGWAEGVVRPDEGTRVCGV